jgi:hypothetical protein
MTHAPAISSNLTVSPAAPGWLERVLVWLRAFMASAHGVYLEIRACRRSAEPTDWRARVPSLLGAEAISLRLCARLAGMMLGREEDWLPADPLERVLHPPRTWREFHRRLEAVASRLSHVEARAKALVQRILKASQAALPTPVAASRDAEGAPGREASAPMRSDPSAASARGPPVAAASDFSPFAW